MGTSLNGLTPSTTYPALLKTSDNTVINSTLKTISDGSGDDTVLQLSTLRIGIKSDSTVTTQTSSVIQATTVNSSLVIAPNGTGALVAHIPDGTAVGGNSRGTNAVDLQTSRTVNTQVASGVNSVVCGGYANTASSAYSTISGGQSNTASTGTHATVVGGLSNTASGQYATVVGGYNNTASGQFSFIGGFQSVASGAESIAINRGYATGSNSVAIQSSSASGPYAFATTLGNASGEYSVALGRYANANSQASFAGPYSESRATGATALSEGIAYGAFSIVAGQYSQSQTTANYSSVFGLTSNAYLQGQNTNASGSFVLRGDAQQSMITARREAALTTAATTVLSLDGTGVTNLIIPSGNNRAWNVQVNWVAVVTAITGTATGITVGDTITQVQTLGFKRIGGTSSLIGTANTLSTNANTSMSTASMAYSAGGSQEMALTFTGPTFVGGGSVTMRVVARIELAEVAF